jgi:hypothetical protein
MSEPLQALPSEWISRLFSRFQAIYGNRVQTTWKDADPDEVRAVWGDGLARYEAPDIKRALETMMIAYPDFPPTLPRFAAMCRDARSARGQEATKVTYVRYGQPSPEVMAAIHELTADPVNRKRDPKDWARRLVKRDADGETVNLYALASAKEALGV